jgi:hypothetical protein
MISGNQPLGGNHLTKEWGGAECLTVFKKKLGPPFILINRTMGFSRKPQQSQTHTQARVCVLKVFGSRMIKLSLFMLRLQIDYLVVEIGLITCDLSTVHFW